MEYLLVGLLIVIALGVWFFVLEARAVNRGIKAGLTAKLERERQEAASTTVLRTETPPTQDQKSLLTSDEEWHYSTFEQWMADFKHACGKHNSSLEVSGTGESLVDFMEDAPMRRAFRDKVSPHLLGEQFAQQFRVGDFGR